MRETEPHRGAPGSVSAPALKFNVSLAALTALLLPLLIALGFWQLARAEQKTALLAAFEARQALASVPLARLKGIAPDEMHGRVVTVRGAFVAGRDFLLDNSIHRGRVGYQLISPLRQADGSVVLVNRGWVPAGRTRSELPSVMPITRDVALEGEIIVPATDARSRMFEAPGWPCVVAAVDTKRIATILQTAVHPYVVLARPGQEGVFEVDRPVANIVPGRHTAYAWQWFLLAAVLLGGFILGGTNVPELIAAKRRNISDERNR